MSRENNRRLRLFGRGRKYIAPPPFHGNLSSLESESAQFTLQKIANRTFITSDGFNIDELTGESDDVHGGKNKSSRGGTGI
jgi:hypothetical protein